MRSGADRATFVGAILHGKLRPETPCAVVVSGGNIDDVKWQKLVG